jgi:hypothetical protein
MAARPREREQVRLQVVANQAGSKHTGDSRNRGKGGQPVWRSRRPIVEGMEMRTFGDEQHVAMRGSRPAFVSARVRGASGVVVTRSA